MANLKRVIALKIFNEAMIITDLYNGSVHEFFKEQKIDSTMKRVTIDLKQPKRYEYPSR